MKIGLILDPYGEQAPAGLARASLEIARALIERHRDLEFFVYTKGNQQQTLPFTGDNWSSHPLGSGSVFLASIPERDGINCLVSLTPVLPLFIPRIPRVVVALDFAYRSFSRGMRERVRSAVLRFVHGYSFHRATKIIAISNYTAGELARYHGSACDKVVVIHEGFTPTVPQNIGSRTEAREKKTILSVSVIKERKNTLGIIEGFARYRRRQPDSVLRLVLVGKGSGTYLERIKTAIREHKLKNFVTLAGFVPGEAFASYYADACVFVYPSFIEGFGMPILEAMHAGVPVITSRGGATEEVAGGAAVLVDADDPETIADAIESVTKNDALRLELVRLGLERAKCFSWANAADRYAEVIKALL